MTIEVTCQCGRVLKAPDSASGRKGRCKGCGAILRVPDLTPEPPGVGLDPGIPLATMEPDPAEAVVDAGGPAIPPGLATVDDEDDGAPPPLRTPTWTPKLAAPAIPAEPWYYGFLDGYATVTLWFIAAVAGLSLFLALYLIASPYYAIAGLMVAGYAAAFAAVTVPACASVKMAVAIARNVRAMRMAATGGDAP